MQLIQKICEKVRASGRIVMGRGAEQVQAALLQKGYIVAKRSGLEVLRLDPPLTIPEEEIDSFLEAFGQVLERISWREFIMNQHL